MAGTQLISSPAPATGTERWSRGTRRLPGRRPRGLTLVELVLGGGMLVIALTGLLQAWLSHLTLNEHSRYLSWATNDADRVMEGLHQQNASATCSAPTATPPAGFASWDAWLADTTANGGGGKSIQPNPAVNELVVLSTGGADPLQVTVAVCWRNRGRTLGECAWDGAALSPNPASGGDPAVTESPAMLSTLLSCRR